MATPHRKLNGYEGEFIERISMQIMHSTEPPKEHGDGKKYEKGEKKIPETFIISKLLRFPETLYFVSQNNCFPRKIQRSLTKTLK